jgi:uncharacterized HhH-GPD family protein
VLRLRDRQVEPRSSSPSRETESASEAKERRRTASSSDRSAVAHALLTYAASYAAPEGEATEPLTPDAEADAFVRSDSFAFLLGVIFDEGMPFERAWRAPLELHRRLGHLDPTTIADSPDTVALAVRQPPALHRFTSTAATRVVDAAKRVSTEYRGDASRIWSDHPTARDLQTRLQAFNGIGQKKAAMAVELLERHLRVPITLMEGSDVAYDIHVRRVFLRTGLAARDDPQVVIAAARELHPDRPGALDDPAWRIGKQWCHASNPTCSSCALTDVCPRLVHLGIGVKGA